MRFRIERTDGDGFTIDRSRYETVLRPIGTRARSEPVSTGWRIRAEKATFTFEFVPEGLEVTVEGTMLPQRVRLLVKEIAENIAAYTDQHGRVVELDETAPGK